MTQHFVGHNRAVFDGLHPMLYKTIAGLALWFALSAWLLFSGTDYTSLTFAVVTLFFLIAILVPTAIWQTWRRHSADASPARNPTVRLSDWTAGTFETWQCRLSGSEAAVQVLLPIAAVALGLMAIGIVFVAVGGAA